MKKHYFILLFIPLLWACKKDPPLSYCTEFPDDCFDVREVKDYFYFNYGSWWVYVEENSGKRDSVYVTETSTDPNSVLFATRLFSSYDGYEYRFWTSGVDPSVNKNRAKKSEISTRVIRNKTKAGDHVAEATCFLFYPVIGLSRIAYGGTYIGYDNVLEIGDIYSDYLVNGENFKDVVKVIEEHTAVEESQPTIHYYTPNVGIIKKELIDSNQIWSLVDYHIVK